MAKTNPITKEIANCVASVIHRTWAAICFDMPASTKNRAAIEVTLDADYAQSYGGSKAEVAAFRDKMRELYDTYGYAVVLKGLSKHIQLV